MRCIEIKCTIPFFSLNLHNFLIWYIFAPPPATWAVVHQLCHTVQLKKLSYGKSQIVFSDNKLQAHCFGFLTSWMHCKISVFSSYIIFLTNPTNFRVSGNVGEHPECETCPTGTYTEWTNWATCTPCVGKTQQPRSPQPRRMIVVSSEKK